MTKGWLNSLHQEITSLIARKEMNLRRQVKKHCHFGRANVQKVNGRTVSKNDVSNNTWMGSPARGREEEEKKKMIF